MPNLANIDGAGLYVSGGVTLGGIENLPVETGPVRGVFRLSGIDVEERRDGLDVRIGLTEPGADLLLRCKQVKVAIDAR